MPDAGFASGVWAKELKKEQKGNDSSRKGTKKGAVPVF